jgi:peptidoglycan/LPS O-acetylase OafA/YrhL
LNKQSSLVSIDILRALAALGVFFYHQHVGALLAAYTHIPFIGITDNLGAMYAVPLFFLISGFCIHLSNIKYLSLARQLPLKEYYKSRFLRIYPPYLAALAMVIAINYFTYGQVPTLTDAVVHLFSVQGFTVKYFNSINVVLWTISIELGFYAIYPVFYYIRLKYSLNKALFFALMVSIISITFFSAQDKLSAPDRFCVFNLWFAWCCGAYIADKLRNNEKKLLSPVFALFYLIIIVGTVAIHMIPNNLNIIFDQLNVLIWTGPLILLITNEYWLKKHGNIFIKTTVKIGLSSYSLYLLHEPLITLKNFLAYRYLPAKLQLAGMALGIILIPVMAWFSYFYVEMPFITKKKLWHQQKRTLIINVE